MSSIHSSDGEVNLNVRDLPYDPKDNDSIKGYLDTLPSSNIRETDEGHQYCIDPANGRFIFIPFGDRDQARVIKVTLFDNGKKIPVGNQLAKIAKVFSVCYDSIEDFKQANFDKPTHKFSAYVIDMSKNKVLGFVNPDNMDKVHTHGIKINVDDSKWQSIRDILGFKTAKGESEEAKKKNRAEETEDSELEEVEEGEEARRAEESQHSDTQSSDEEDDSTDPRLHVDLIDRRLLQAPQEEQDNLLLDELSSQEEEQDRPVSRAGVDSVNPEWNTEAPNFQKMRKLYTEAEVLRKECNNKHLLHYKNSLVDLLDTDAPTALDSARLALEINLNNDAIAALEAEDKVLAKAANNKRFKSAIEKHKKLKTKLEEINTFLTELGGDPNIRIVEPRATVASLTDSEINFVGPEDDDEDYSF